MVGDGSYLMMAQEIVTAVQEGYQADHRPARQPRLREHRRPLASVGCAGFGTHYRFRDAETGELDGDLVPVDFAANAASLGAHGVTACTPRRD